MSGYEALPPLADLFENIMHILGIQVEHMTRDNIDECLAEVDLAGLYEMKAVGLAMEKEAERACLTAQIIVAELQARIAYLNNYTARREGVYESTQQMFEEE